MLVYGCDLLSNRNIRGSYRYGYDGRDFLSCDLASKRFVAADSSAEVTRRCWEDENVPEVYTNYLGHECPEWIQKHVRYAQKELDRKGGSRIPVGMWDLGMEDLGTREFQWVFHGQISPPSHSHGMSLTVIPFQSPLMSMCLEKRNTGR